MELVDRDGLACPCTSADLLELSHGCVVPLFAAEPVRAQCHSFPGVCGILEFIRYIPHHDSLERPVSSTCGRDDHRCPVRCGHLCVAGRFARIHDRYAIHSRLCVSSGFWKVGAEYLFYRMSALSSLITALLYLASARLGRQLPCGYFWIGCHISDVTWNGRNWSIFYINHLVPQTLEPDDFAMHRASVNSGGSMLGFGTCNLPEAQSTRIKDVLKLLL